MKYLKIFKEHVNKKESSTNIRFIIKAMNDLIDIAIEEIDNVADKYKRSDIVILFQLDNKKIENYVFFTESRNEKEITLQDLIFNQDLDNLSFDIDDCELIFDIRLFKDGSYEKIDLSFNVIFNRMEQMYPDLELDIFDPYSW
jgi:hypothetical protein